MAYITFQPSDYFKTKIYTGTGSSNAVTGVRFQPDWCWFKNRSTADGHRLVDVIRGVTKEIYADNVSYTEQTEAQGLTAFGADGFTVGTAADYNGNGNNIVCWNWRAGGTGSSNSDGSISSTVSVNNTSGFSIVKYTGTGSNATVGHGLNTTPKLVIIRNYSRAGENWRVGSITGTVQGTGASNFGASAIR